MSFLAPLFLLGAAAIALPIVFHLIRRTTREKTLFSSLMFLQPTPPRVTRRSRLEDILLLLLRCLALCLLAFGFARPFLQQSLPANDATGPEKNIVLLLDTSASLQRENLWAEARSRAGAVLRDTTPADHLAVFTFDREVRPLITFSEWEATPAGERVRHALQRITAAQPGWAGTHLGAALLQASEAFEDKEQQQTRPGIRRIVVVTDLQEGSRLDRLQGFEWPRGIQVVIEQVKPRRPTNAGLQFVAEREEQQLATTEAAARVRVSNSSDARREQFELRWDGVAGAPPLDVYVPPGQSRILPAPKLPADAVTAKLVLTGDDATFDNTAHFIAPKPERINVLYLGNDAEGDATQPAYFLRRAFQQTRRQDVTVVARPASAPLLITDVTAASLIVVTDGLAGDRVKNLQRVISEGKAALFAPKSANDVAALADLFNLGTLPANEAAGGGYALLGQIDFTHPLFAPFADPRYSDFTKIHFWRHRRVDTDKLPNARVLARFDNGDAALAQAPLGKGTVFLLTSGWHPGDSQLALSTKFVPLLYSLLEQGGGARPAWAQFTVGDEVPLPAGAASATGFTIQKPDGTTVTLEAGAKKFSGTDAPGIYTITSAEPPVRFAVNLDPAESKTAPLAPEQLQSFGVPLKPSAPEDVQLSDQRRQWLQAAELESRQKLWRWLLVAALMLLVFETWLAGRLNRKAVTAPATT
jgi:hypothetical protein